MLVFFPNSDQLLFSHSHPLYKTYKASLGHYMQTDLCQAKETNKSKALVG